jgi:hypothetical protein
LSYALGLKKLGFRAYVVEQIGRDECVDRNGRPTAFEQSANLAYFRRVMEQFELSGSAALIFEGGEQIDGLQIDELLELAGTTELLVNVSGHLTMERLMRRFRHKAYIDLDPGFTQFWHASRNRAARLEGHDSYFTVGENIGTPACSIPTGDIAWGHTRPPVVLDHWPVSNEGSPNRFTTVASWRGPYGPVEYGGRTYGLKVHEFRKFAGLPAQAPQEFEVALDIHDADQKDLALLRRHGWKIIDPAQELPDPSSFRAYVQLSGAEFSPAQAIYVETESGWFSDRTTRYLASGRPALVQDTGFSRNYPVGEGLVAFRTLEEAIAGAERIAGDYDAHCQAARELAEDYFDSDKVLGQVLEQVGVGS